MPSLIGNHEFAGRVTPARVQRLCAACEDEESRRAAEPRIQRLALSGVKIGEPDDLFEREADRIADCVVGAAAKRRQSGEPVPSVSTPEIRVSPSQLTSGGSALTSETRTFFEERMGRVFSGVRVHSGSEAASITSGLHSSAFTYGNHVWVSSPRLVGRTRTLAHELAHVVQQGRAPPVGAATETITPTLPARIQRELMPQEQSAICLAACTCNSLVNTASPQVGNQTKDLCATTLLDAAGSVSSLSVQPPYLVTQRGSGHPLFLNSQADPMRRSSFWPRYLRFIDGFRAGIGVVRIPDAVAVHDPSSAPEVVVTDNGEVHSNIRSVVEIKFPGDRWNPGQASDYRLIAGSGDLVLVTINGRTVRGDQGDTRLDCPCRETESEPDRARVQQQVVGLVEESGLELSVRLELERRRDELRTARPVRVEPNFDEVVRTLPAPYGLPGHVVVLFAAEPYYQQRIRVAQRNVENVTRRLQGLMAPELDQLRLLNTIALEGAINMSLIAANMAAFTAALFGVMVIPAGATISVTTTTAAAGPTLMVIQGGGGTAASSAAITDLSLAAAALLVPTLALGANEVSAQEARRQVQAGLSNPRLFIPAMIARDQRMRLTQQVMIGGEQYRAVAFYSPSR